MAVALTPGLDGADRPRVVCILDAKSGEEKARIPYDSNSLVSIHWTPDSNDLLIAAGGKVLRAPFAEPAAIKEIELPHLMRLPGGEIMPGAFFRGVFFRDGHRIITAGGLPELYGWDLTTGERLWIHPLPGSNVRGLELSPDERLLACVVQSEQTKEYRLRLVEIATRRELATYDLGLENTTGLAFSADGRRLLAGFDDGTALVYDISEAKHLLRDN